MYSNELQVKMNTPPTFLWHTANDYGVPAENSMLYAMALSQYRIPYELHIFEDGDHGLGLAENHSSVSQWTGICAKWLTHRGWCEV